MMNTNEIIQFAQKQLADTKRFMESMAPHGYGVCGYSKEDDFWNSIIKELSATIPRETAKCKPAIDDTIESDSGRRDALAYNGKDGEWQAVDYICVSMYPKIYTHWLPVPAAPEVETKTTPTKIKEPTGGIGTNGHVDHTYWDEEKKCYYTPMGGGA